MRLEMKRWFDTLSGNRTRVKGVEDPHSTTELSAWCLRVEVLGIEPRLTGSKPAVLTTALYLWDSRAGSRTRAEAVKEPYPNR